MRTPCPRSCASTACTPAEVIGCVSHTPTVVLRERFNHGTPLRLGRTLTALPGYATKTSRPIPPQFSSFLCPQPINLNGHPELTRHAHSDPSPARRVTSSWPAWLICPDRKVVAELTDLLAREAPSMRLECAAAFPDPDAGLPWAAGAAPGVCFLDVCSDPQRAVRLVSRISQPPLGIPVVVVLSQSNYELALGCLRHGACGCLVRPFDRQQLQPVLLRIGSTGDRA